MSSNNYYADNRYRPIHMVASDIAKTSSGKSSLAPCTSSSTMYRFFKPVAPNYAPLQRPPFQMLQQQASKQPDFSLSTRGHVHRDVIVIDDDDDDDIEIENENSYSTIQQSNPIREHPECDGHLEKIRNLTVKDQVLHRDRDEFLQEKFFLTKPKFRELQPHDNLAPAPDNIPTFSQLVEKRLNYQQLPTNDPFFNFFKAVQARDRELLASVPKRQTSPCGESVGEVLSNFSREIRPVIPDCPPARSLLSDERDVGPLAQFLRLQQYTLNFCDLLKVTPDYAKNMISYISDSDTSIKKLVMGLLNILKKELPTLASVHEDEAATKLLKKLKSAKTLTARNCLGYLQSYVEFHMENIIDFHDGGKPTWLNEDAMDMNHLCSWEPVQKVALLNYLADETLSSAAIRTCLDQSSDQGKAFEKEMKQELMHIRQSFREKDAVIRKELSEFRHKLSELNIHDDAYLVHWMVASQHIDDKRDLLKDLKARTDADIALVTRRWRQKAQAADKRRIKPLGNLADGTVFYLLTFDEEYEDIVVRQTFKKVHHDDPLTTDPDDGPVEETGEDRCDFFDDENLPDLLQHIRALHDKSIGKRQLEKELSHIVDAKRHLAAATQAETSLEAEKVADKEASSSTKAKTEAMPSACSSSACSSSSHSKSH